jgi:hypothetical protein
VDSNDFKKAIQSIFYNLLVVSRFLTISHAFLEKKNTNLTIFNQARLACLPIRCKKNPSVQGQYSGFLSLVSWTKISNMFDIPSVWQTRCKHFAANKCVCVIFQKTWQIVNILVSWSTKQFWRILYDVRSSDFKRFMR